jgi:hypothetical protein
MPTCHVPMGSTRVTHRTVHFAGTCFLCEHSSERRGYTKPEVGCCWAGGALSATGKVWNRRKSVISSDVDLLGNLDRIIDFDAEVLNGALDPYAPQELYRLQISSPPVDQYRLRAAQRVRRELRGIEPNASVPTLTLGSLF